MATVILILIVLFFGQVLDQPAEVVTAPGPTIDVPTQDWQPVTVSGIEGVIVAPRDTHLFVDPLGLELDDDAYWTPSVVDVEEAEAAIAEEAGALDHRRQYAGYVEDGQRKIYINGFCDDLGIDWLEEPVMVDDGGDCYFTAIYNVDTGELERFGFNGQA